MLQCLFYVNDLPGGEAHHDGGMKGRDAAGGAGEPACCALTADETRRARIAARRSRRGIVVTDRASRRRARRT